MSQVIFYPERGDDPDHRWKVQDDNNRVVATGEGYETEAGAREGFINAATAMTDALANLSRDTRAK